MKNKINAILCFFIVVFLLIALLFYGFFELDSKINMCDWRSEFNRDSCLGCSINIINVNAELSEIKNSLREVNKNFIVHDATNNSLQKRLYDSGAIKTANYIYHRDELLFLEDLLFNKYGRRMGEIDDRESK